MFQAVNEDTNTTKNVILHHLDLWFSVCNSVHNFPIFKSWWFSTPQLLLDSGIRILSYVCTLPKLQLS